jgi:ribonuclease VapC
MFVDASAIVAMMAGEEDAKVLAARLDRSAIRTTSPIGIFEASAAVARLLALSVSDASEAVRDFLALADIEVLPVPIEAGAIAIDAFARYGKGRKHAAQLNMGDCFAYACARHHGYPLLYKGTDFAETDIEPA